MGQHSNFDINIQSWIQTYKRVKRGQKQIQNEVWIWHVLNDKLQAGEFHFVFVVS